LLETENHPKTILIIEDDINSLEFMESLLENENYHCIKAESGEEALEILENEDHPDLILLDIMLGGIDGYEVCKTIKSETNMRYIPIIIISGKSSTEEKILGLKVGADDYIVKPFKNKELIAKIQGLLRIKELHEQLINVEKIAGIGRLASGIAHEFNNLIGGMLGYAQLGQLNLDDKKMVKKAFSVIEESCFRAKELTENMLLFSSSQVETESIADIGESLKNTLIIVSNELRKHNIKVTKKFTHNSYIQANSNRLLQIFTNIIQNSIHAIIDSDERFNREIIIETKEDENKVYIFFKDNGIGIKPEFHNKIFDPFFTTKGALGGGTTAASGMGLSAAYGIVASYRGKINLIKSSPGETVFKISFYKTETTPKKKFSSKAKKRNKDKKLSGKVLIVDDEKIYCDLLSDTAKEIGLDVTVVQSGEEAIKATKNENFDMIFMDYLMPGIGGIEAAKAIRESDKDNVIIFITGKKVMNQLQESLDMEPIEYLTKPFDLKKLVNLMRNILAKE